MATASRASKLTFLGACTFTVGTIAAVHLMKENDFETRRKFLDSNDELRRKLKSNELDHERHQKLQEELSKDQAVSKTS
ncbi:hypothetical protein HDV05_004164 [Chytridiales sp. JEL 0842]|nr:hypothetical protein HDV05_004164 [Chytridiales sp. JEL 0842]